MHIGNKKEMKKKSSAIAHANIALIKYWGRSQSHDPLLNIPLNDTVSMTKYGTNKEISLCTHTTIEFSTDYSEDVAIVNHEILTGSNLQRVLRVIDWLRQFTDLKWKFKLVSENDFPTQAGLASSASAFSALVVAVANALELDLSMKELTTIARIGSGSAARSIYGGFVYCYKGNSHETAYAEQICKPENFGMNAVIAIVDQQKKKISSDMGHEFAFTSPFNEIRIQKSQIQAFQIRQAILEKDFSTIGQIAEQNCMYMHSVMMTSQPPLFYWNPVTLKIIKTIIQYREEGLECYYTIDAGPNVHCLCRPDDVSKIQSLLQKIDGVQLTLIAEPGEDAYLTQKHLF